MKRTIILLLLLVVGIVALILVAQMPQPGNAQFDGERALQDVAFQINLGPRIPSSEAHSRVIDWISDELTASDWVVELQMSEEMGHPIKNIIAKRNSAGPWIILCAHYDSRQVADRDPDPNLRSSPVPGANDGASGVAILLELARTIPADTPLNIWLVFLDAEDQGNIPGWDWILGSTAFVRILEGTPDAVILLDMIGDTDLKVLIEQNSTQTLALEVWTIAEQAGYGDKFIKNQGPSLLDDHIPFIRAGIPAIDIIDFEYPYWHTTQDTLDKVSAQSLKAIGDTIIQWLEFRVRLSNP